LIFSDLFDDSTIGVERSVNSTTQQEQESQTTVIYANDTSADRTDRR